MHFLTKLHCYTFLAALAGILGFLGLGTGTIVYDPQEPVNLVEIKKTDALPKYVHYARIQADKHKVDWRLMMQVMACESDFDADVQSRHRMPDGTREVSYGLAQIFLPAHPHVSKDEATRWRYAIRFMAEHFAANNHSYWTCYRQLAAK
jgi:hypothetical protein